MTPVKDPLKCVLLVWLRPTPGMTVSKSGQEYLEKGADLVSHGWYEAYSAPVFLKLLLASSSWFASTSWRRGSSKWSDWVACWTVTRSDFGTRAFFLKLFFFLACFSKGWGPAVFGSSVSLRMICLVSTADLAWVSPFFLEAREASTCSTDSNCSISEKILSCSFLRWVSNSVIVSEKEWEKLAV